MDGGRQGQTKSDVHHHVSLGCNLAILEVKMGCKVPEEMSEVSAAHVGG